MGLVDSIKGMFGGKKADNVVQQVQDTVQQGQEWVQNQEVVQDVQQKAGEVVEQAKDAVASVDIPGTNVDDKIKDALGVDGNNDQQPPQAPQPPQTPQA